MFSHASFFKHQWELCSGWKIQPFNLPVLPLNCSPGTSFCNTLAREGRKNQTSFPTPSSTSLLVPAAHPGLCPSPKIPRESTISLLTWVISARSLQKHTWLSAGETGRRQTAPCKTRGGEVGGRERSLGQSPRRQWDGFMFRQLCSSKGCMRTYT